MAPKTDKRAPGKDEYPCNTCEKVLPASEFIPTHDKRYGKTYMHSYCNGCRRKRGIKPLSRARVMRMVARELIKRAADPNKNEPAPNNYKFTLGFDGATLTYGFQSGETA